MRGFRNSRPEAARFAGLLLAILLVAASAASAQQPRGPLGPPISLLPPSAQVPLPIPATEEPVASEPLAPPAPGWSAGVAPPDALSGTLWRGTSRAVAKLLLTRLPDTPSVSLQSLERRLLLSPAAAPEGPDEGETGLPALRAAALLRLGELDAVRVAITAIPQPERGTAMPLAVAADAIGGDVERACASVRETVRRNQSAFWQSALVACQGLQGETDQASLGMQILADEQGSHEDALTAAVDALAGRPAPERITRAQRLDPLTLRLLVKAGRELTPGLIDALGPDLALCLALDEGAPAVARLTAAERAARLGALPPDRLGELYSTQTAVGEPGSLPALDHARRFAAIAKAGSTAERLRRIGEFTEAFGGPKTEGFGLAARLVLPALREIAPDPSLAGSAPLVARLLLAAGDSAAARGWSILAAESEERRMRLLLALASGRGEPSVDESEIGQLPLLFTLFSALGEPLGAADWAHLPTAAWSAAGPPSPPPAAWLELAEAARARRVGETVLASVIVSSPAGRLSTDPVGLFAAVSSLRQVGLEADARRLAVEAALAAGL
jgi:hypothetical protein